MTHASPRQSNPAPPNTLPVPLSNGQSTPSTFPFSTSQRPKHKCRLRLDLAPSIQHSFPFIFPILLTFILSVSYLYLSHHINTSRPASLKGVCNRSPVLPFSFVCACVCRSPSLFLSLAGGRAINNCQSTPPPLFNLILSILSDSRADHRSAIQYSLLYGPSSAYKTPRLA